MLVGIKILNDKVRYCYHLIAIEGWALGGNLSRYVMAGLEPQVDINPSPSGLAGENELSRINQALLARFA